MVSAVGRRWSDAEEFAENGPWPQALRVLESVRAVPKGSFEIQEVLNIAADSLVAAGRLGIFTPMYYHKVRKPD